MRSVILNNGISMPIIGMGTWPLNGIKLSLLAWTAARLGYRHFDTASAYHNEKWLGKGIRFSGIKRADLWITTKLSNEEQRSGDVEIALKNSLERLGMTYVDLYLMHWPNPDTYLASWKMMEALYKNGLARSIGVCNFHQHHLERLLPLAEVIPAVNQIELHPLLSQSALAAFCESCNIHVSAYSPVARMHARLINNPDLVDLAKYHNKTVPQVILRWDYQNGIPVAIKSSSVVRLRENISILDFCLSANEMNMINRLDENFRVRHNPDTCDFSIL